ncbi:hypothetical protein LTR17_019382 [Elasticomyces elasticus]|nr:hypothetical protein LTR17_019382 [Elasticomyces elasticus]
MVALTSDGYLLATCLSKRLASRHGFSGPLSHDSHLDEYKTYQLRDVPGCHVDLEQDSVSSSSIVISINGFVGLTNDPGVDFDNIPLPQQPFDPSGDKLYVYADTPQGVYYEVDGAAPSRNISFEWYTSHYSDPTQYYHLIATFEEANPGVTTFTYYEISDHGSSATFGMQGTDGPVDAVLIQQWRYHAWVGVDL